MADKVGELRSAWCRAADDYSYSRDAAKAMLAAAWIKMQDLYAGLGLAPPV
jgi:hypothetical protein